MGGGVIQLVFPGIQDTVLIGNPQITFFKMVYMRYTPFAIVSEQQFFYGQPTLGDKIHVNIDKKGDLLYRIYLVAQLRIDDSLMKDGPYEGELFWDESSSESLINYNSTTSAVGFDDRDAIITPYSIIDNVAIEIGGQIIDKHTGQWLDLWTKISSSIDKYEMLERMMSPDNDYSYMPLQFWFCRNVGLALPLIALDRQAIKIHFEFSTLDKTPYRFWKTDYSIEFPDFNEAGGQEDVPVQLWCDYIYLDTEQRRFFAQKPHEYLIEQVQMYKDYANTRRDKCIVLPFNHPVKELIWVVQNQFERGTEHSILYDQNYWNNRIHNRDQLSCASLYVDDKLLFEARGSEYYRIVQRYEHHTGSENMCVYIYSFALEPEQYQPTGAFNFSQATKIQLNMLLEKSIDDDNYSKSRSVTIYAVSYNVLRIMSGFGGILFQS
tara:strand:- start:317 stop:1624 length:1308 start_codon:yes stop_codon:yes gene_type:complete